jgi:lipoprotein-releasing system ATP-binding protein
MGLEKSDPGASPVAVRIRELWRRYGAADQTLEILRGVDLQVEEGEGVAIVGRSGAGKSTLLHLLGLLDQPSSGSIELGGIDFSRASRAARDRVRREQIGFVFQFYHLLPELTAEQNVVLAGMISRGPITWLRQRHEHRRHARELLERVGLGNRTTQSPGKLSGGERQRVAIARALFRKPRLLLCDEPTGNLDEVTSQEVEDLLLGLQWEHGMTSVLVTHNLNLAGRMNRILRLEAGRLSLVEEAPGEEASTPEEPSPRPDGQTAQSG